MIPISYIGEYFVQGSKITSGSRYYLLQWVRAELAFRKVVEVS